jgi:hypothetical protein
MSDVAQLLHEIRGVNMDFSIFLLGWQNVGQPLQTIST